MTSNLLKLVKKGLVEQKVGLDRRVKILKNTKAGERVLEERAALLAQCECAAPVR